MNVNPTTFIKRFADAVELLCKKRPSDEIVVAWVDRVDDDTRLQEFAIEHGPEWAQGIAVLDAAHVLASQPTEDVEHEPGPTHSDAAHQIENLHPLASTLKAYVDFAAVRRLEGGFISQELDELDRGARQALKDYEQACDDSGSLPVTAAEPFVIKSWAYGSTSGRHDYLMSDGTIETLTTDEAKARAKPKDTDFPRLPDPDAFKFSAGGVSLVDVAPHGGAWFRLYSEAKLLSYAIGFAALMAKKSPGEAPSMLQSSAADHGWLREGGMVYRLTDERRPTNRDEIRVTMADGSRTPEACARRAGALLDRLQSTHSGLHPLPSHSAYAVIDSMGWALDDTEKDDMLSLIRAYERRRGILTPGEMASTAEVEV